MGIDFIWNHPAKRNFKTKCFKENKKKFYRTYCLQNSTLIYIKCYNFSLQKIGKSINILKGLLKTTSSRFFKITKAEFNLWDILVYK